MRKQRPHSPEKTRSSPSPASSPSPNPEIDTDALSALSIEEAILLGINPLNHFNYRVIDVIKKRFAVHYQKHPDHETDTRGKAALNSAYFGITEILEMLAEDYEVHYRRLPPDQDAEAKESL